MDNIAIIGDWSRRSRRGIPPGFWTVRLETLQQETDRQHTCTSVIGVYLYDWRTSSC